MTQLFHIDYIVVNGQSLAIEDGSATLEGAAGWENEVVPSSSGDDYTKRKRVARQLHTKLQFGPAVNPDDLAKIEGAQIAMRDSVTGRKVVAPNCNFAKLGALGSGSADITFNLLASLQWM